MRYRPNTAAVGRPSLSIEVLSPTATLVDRTETKRSLFGHFRLPPFSGTPSELALSPDYTLNLK